MHRKSLVLLAASLLLTGCYRITVTSGARPGTEVVDVPFSHSFVVGFVPPAEVNVKDTCASGVSSIRTQHSFVNGLVSILSAALYTPIYVRVTCSTR